MITILLREPYQRKWFHYVDHYTVHNKKQNLVVVILIVFACMSTALLQISCISWIAKARFKSLTLKFKSVLACSSAFATFSSVHISKRPQKGKCWPLGWGLVGLRHIWAHLKQCFPAVSSCFPSSGIFLAGPPTPSPFLHHHHHPLFLHVKLGRQVYTLIFKAALFSVKCCVATSNALPDRAFLGFQRGGRIIGGRPQRIWQMCDEFLLERFFGGVGVVYMCVCWGGG